MTRVTTHATQGMTNSMQRQSAAITERARTQQAASTRQAADAQRAQLEARAAQLAETAAVQVEQQAAARKDAAWQAFFKPKTA